MSEEQIITQDEMDALLSGVSEGEVEAETGTPTPDGEVLRYDFVHPQHQLDASLPVLHVINEKLAKTLGPALSLVVHKPVDVEVVGVDMLKYGEYTEGLPPGTSLNRIKMHPLSGNAMFNLDPTITLIMVDVFFGGAGKVSDEPLQRDYTATEQRIIGKVLEACFESTMDAWSETYEFRPEFIRSESSLRATSPANPAEVMITSRFKLTMATGEGEFHIALPYSMIEPIRPFLVSNIERKPVFDPEWSNLFAERIMDAEIDINGVLDRTEISLGDLLNMTDGDLIPIGQNRSAEFYAEHLRLFDAMIGVSNGRVSAKIAPTEPGGQWN